MLILADVLCASSFGLQKAFQKNNGTSVLAGLYFTMMSSFFRMFALFVMSGFKLSFTPFSFIMALIQTSLVTIYTLISFKILKTGTLALYTLFLMTGGMVVPYIWGLLFLNEGFSYLRTFALVIIIIAVALSNVGGEKTNFKQLMLCSAVFIINGFVSVSLKMHQVNTRFDKLSSAEFSLLGNIITLITTALMFYILSKKDTSNIAKKIKNKPVKSKISMYMLFTVLAIAGAISSILQLKGAVDIPATVLYPVITGGTIVFSSIIGIIFFKDKLNLRMILSIVLCFIGTLMFL